MNRIHRTVWNERRGVYMAVSEHSAAQGKSAGASAIAAVLASVLLGVTAQASAAGPAAAALPTSAQVTAGQAQIGTAGKTMTIIQGTDKAAINWGTFSIGKDATVQFVQPNAGSVALNRVIGTEGSVIDGALKANGQVFVLNPNGVLFGKDARVDTAGLVATTLKLSDADFLAGKTSFAGHGGSVVNQGSLTAKDGGYIALIGQQVKNDGVITARLGTVALASGNKVSLNFNGNALVGMVVDEGALDALVANGGAVRADGGLVVLTAKGAEGLVDTLVNNTGEIRAQTIENKAGRIYLLGEGGKVEVAGTLDASAPAGDGGFIETSGSTLVVKDGATVRTNASNGQSGTWLIDPTNFTISAGTGSQTTSGIGASTLQTALGTGNVTIQTQSAGTDAGDINVNAPVSWAANLLTLEAHGDINVNAVMTASGTSTLNLKTGYNFNTGAPTFDATKTVNMAMDANGVFTGRIDIDRTGTGILTINNSGYTLVNTVGAAGDDGASSSAQTLQSIAQLANLTGNYALASNVDASTTSGWNSGVAFMPIGGYSHVDANSYAVPFSGAFDGLGHTITGLTVAQNSTGVYGQAGLFGVVSNGVLRNVALTAAQISGSSNVGALVGYVVGATFIANASSSGSVSGGSSGADLGGLVGYADGSGPGGVMRNVRSAATITGGSSGNSNVGGLVGHVNSFDISDASATGNVTTPGAVVGGLLGSFEAGTLTRGVATGTVSAGSFAIGGLIGISADSTLAHCSASGPVTGTGNEVGGLIGEIDATSSMTDSHSSGAVSGGVSGFGIGGLIGASYGPVSIESSSSSSNVSGGSSVGGLVGYLGDSTVASSSATGTVTGTSDGVGGLIGTASSSSITASQSSGSVTSASGTGVGGLVGANTTAGILTIDSSSSSSNVTGGSNVGGGVGLGEVVTITDTHVSGAVTGHDYVGGLVGTATGYIAGPGGGSSSIGHSSAAGNVSADLGYAGGLIGDMSGTIADSYASGAVALTGGDYAGGLIGHILDSSITNSYATGAVVATGTRSYVGGLAGSVSNVTISGTYATGNVSSGGDDVGGLIGHREDGSIAVSFASGNVSGGNHVGGLVGYDDDSNGTSATTINAYARGSVSGSNDVGGLFGYSASNTTTNVYSTGHVSGTTNVGGLIGERPSGHTAPTNSFWDVQTAGVGTDGSTANSAGGTGRTTADMNTTATYTTASWDFAIPSGIWARKDSVNDKYPVFRLFGYTDPLTLTLADTSKIYGDANPALGSYTVTGCPTSSCVTAVAFGSAIDLTTGVGTYAYSAANVLNLSFASGYSASQFELIVSNGISITPRPVSVATLAGATRVYDGTTDAAGALLALGNLVNGDSVSLSGSATLGSASAGTKAVIGLGTLTLSSPNYTLSGVTPLGTVEITPRPLGVAPVNGAARVYDATTDVDASMLQTSGILYGDTVNLSGTGMLASKNVGAQTVGLGTLLIDNSDYMLVGVTGTISVTPVTLSIATLNGATRVYDATTDAAASLLQTSGVLSGDTVNLSGTGTLASKNVGAQTVGLGTLALDNGNYTLVGVVPTGTVAITPRSVSVATATGATRVYDGTTDAAGTLFTLVNLAGNDAVSLTGTTALAGANAGVQSVSSLGTLAISDSNYVLTSVTPTGTVTVTARPLSIAAVNNATRVYDATTDAAASLLQTSGVLSGDTVNLSGTGTLASKNVGAQTVGLGTLALDNGNYTLVGVTPTGTISITPLTLSIATLNGAARVYDATTDAVASLLQTSGVLSGDTVNLSGTGTLASKNVGAQTVGIGTLALDNANYTLVGVTPTGTISITPRSLSIATLNGATRVYDATTDAVASLLQTSGVLSGDTVNLSGTGTLVSKNVGAQTVGIGTLALDNANYTLVGVTPSGTVTITARPVTLATVTGASKVYDGSTDAPSSLVQVGGVLAGDTANLSGTGTLASKNAGARSVGLGTLALDNANYTVVGVVPTGTVAIQPRTLNLSFTVADKTFDGSTAASATASDDRVTGDQFTTQFSAAFGDTNAGAAKPVTFTGLALTGADAGNYQIAPNTGSGVAGNMLRRNLTYTLAPQDPTKTYTANGTVLVSASALDQLVVASFANTVAGTSPGALSYTIFKNGQQVSAITDAGTYEIRASFAAADPHYALASTGNSALTIVVAAAGTPPVSGTTPPSTGTTPPVTGTTPSSPVAVASGEIGDVIGQAVRTDVPASNVSVLAYAGAGAPRSLVDYSAMPPNVATSPAALTAAFGEGVPLSLLSSPSGAEPSQAVTLAQASSMVASSDDADAEHQNVRVPAGRNSLVQIVNGGVKLPPGVDQLLFVVKTGK